MDASMPEMTQLLGGLLLVGVVAWLVWQRLKRRALLDIRDRWFVVTGCDSGIGQGVVRKLVEAGASVVAFTFTEEGARAALPAVVGSRESCTTQGSRSRGSSSSSPWTTTGG
jgi:hypothetical protein